jgi:uncharacterized protein (TIGR03435 family)
MKKLILCLIAAAVFGSVLLAQNPENITGTWQGALKAPNGQQLRLVFKFSLEDDKYKAVLYSIDQRSPAIPATSMTRDGSSIKVAIGAINGNFEGKLSADGNSIVGTFTQGAPQPLTLARATPETAWAIPEPPPPPVRMAANAKPGIEVSTVKPSDPNRPGKLFTIRGADVVTINTTLSDLITMAYDLHPKQISGAPQWVESDKFDLTIRPDVPGQPNVDQMKIIIQKLLADRFQLKFHKDKKELAVYALTVGKGGQKISKSQRDPDSLPGLFFGGPPPGMTLNVTNATMDQFTSLMQSAVLDKPVIDQTGLKEKYDFILKWTPDAGQLLGLRGGAPAPPPADVPDAPPDLFTAVQQQLGLKLDSTRAPADVIVLDKVEKPSEN